MSTQFVPAADVRPETFTVRAADHIDRGRRRGQTLRTGIASTLAAYRRYFAHLSIAEADVRSAAMSSFARLQEWSPTDAEEVAAAAEGAGVEVAELMEIIARTEIMTLAAAAPTECSTVSFTSPGASVAAQNWDWAADFSTLWHINDVGSVPGQHRHVGIAEFGMLGKIGLNEAGVGVLLNILKHTGDGPGGVPIHMILNRVLSRASTLAEALEIIHSSPTSSSSIITVITAEAAVQVEIAGETKRERRADGRGFLIHTNHFLHPDLLDGALELRPDSTSQERGRHLEQVVARFEADRAATGEAEPAVEPPEPAVGESEPAAGDAENAEAENAESGTAADAPVSVADLTRLLTTGPGEAPVCCTPAPDAAYGNRSATLVSVRIDPARRQIDLAPGSPADGMRGNRRFQL
ncbi:C45 family peptidase [Brevibacterium sp. S111]|uniref:C45 family autoproteolytic acyltransferase/hydolase n=1 Tax=unclassified Brevibacterium TaxID=2614124 RepID=UPI00108018DC|nr:C45 family peptidase [Brevibacterium sp. S111]TGD11001.1 isopenicillin acyltransferase [Brevibacterium sp. S111]